MVRKKEETGRNRNYTKSSCRRRGGETNESREAGRRVRTVSEPDVTRGE
jgi:hypothetical protein